jgi:hypothetical protein
VKRSRAVQDAIRDQLVAAALAERPRRRRRTAFAVAAGAALLGATAMAQATGVLAVGKPIQTLMPGADRERLSRYRAPQGATLSVTAQDPHYRHAWGVGVYTSAEGKDCAIAGHVLGTRLGRERDGRFHPYGRDVTGTCGDLDQLGQMHDLLMIDGPSPRTVVYGRTTKPGLVEFRYRGHRKAAQPGYGGAFLLVFDGAVAAGDLRLVE